MLLIIGFAAWVVAGLSWGQALDADRRRGMWFLFGLVVLAAFAVVAICGAGGGYSGPLVRR